MEMVMKKEREVRGLHAHLCVGGEPMGGLDLAVFNLHMLNQFISQAVAAVGKDYAQRPASYKGSLSLKIDRYTARKKSR
jgi:hypothetical protein